VVESREIIWTNEARQKGRSKDNGRDGLATKEIF
jgi:hypothetical protein